MLRCVLTEHLRASAGVRLICKSFIDIVANVERFVLVAVFGQVVHIQVRTYLTFDSRAVTYSVPLEIAQCQPLKLRVIFQKTQHIVVTLCNHVVAHRQTERKDCGRVATI